MSSNGRSEALSHHSGLPLPIEIRGIRNARRLRLRLDERRRILMLTGPLRMNRRAALAWAAEQREWIEAQIAATLPDEPFAPGARFPIEGREYLLIWSQAESRTPRLDGDRLVCGGPLPGLARQIEKFLKRQALETLSRETEAMAAVAGMRAAAVSVGDAQTRWGSCAASGRIRYSWRLILAPAEVRRYVVAHEVAHLVHLDHGPKFKALEAQLYGGDVGPARRLLRRLGSRLKRIGRSH